jgi:hypothetical protein
MPPFLIALTEALLFGAVAVFLLGLLVSLVLASQRRIDRMFQVLFITIVGSSLALLFAAIAFVYVIEGVPSVTLVSTLNFLALGTLFATVVGVIKTARGTLSARGKFPFSFPLAATAHPRRDVEKMTRHLSQARPSERRSSSGRHWPAPRRVQFGGQRAFAQRYRAVPTRLMRPDVPALMGFAIAAGASATVTHPIAADIAATARACAARAAAMGICTSRCRR